MVMHANKDRPALYTIAQIPLGSSRHDTHFRIEKSRDVTRRDVSRLTDSMAQHARRDKLKSLLFCYSGLSRRKKNVSDVVESGGSLI